MQQQLAGSCDSSAGCAAISRGALPSCVPLGPILQHVCCASLEKRCQRPSWYASTSPLVLLQLHHQQQFLSVNIINSTIHHLQHAKLRILLQHLTSHAAYERRGGPPKRPAAKRPCTILLLFSSITTPIAAVMTDTRITTRPRHTSSAAACTD